MNVLSMNRINKSPTEELKVQTSQPFTISKKTTGLDSIYPRDYEILGWCPAGTVLPHGGKVPL